MWTLYVSWFIILIMYFSLAFNLDVFQSTKGKTFLFMFNFFSLCSSFIVSSLWTLYVSRFVTKLVSCRAFLWRISLSRASFGLRFYCYNCNLVSNRIVLTIVLLDNNRLGEIDRKTSMLSWTFQLLNMKDHLNFRIFFKLKKDQL